MASFWKQPPRSLASFGIAGLLVDGCTVFHENLYSYRHVGRVSDLIAAALRGAGAAGDTTHELRVRTIILLGFFEAWLAQSQVTPPNEKSGMLGGPLGIECGVDSEKVAIGLSFALPEGQDFRSFAGFEDLLNQLHASSDHLVLRVHPQSLRAELVALVAIPGKMELGELEPVEIVQIGGEKVPEAPAANYVELGDVPYASLLKKDDPEVTVSGAGPRAEEIIKLEATGRETQVDTRVKGATAEDEASQLVKGSAPEKDDAESRFGADAEETEEKLRLNAAERTDEELARSLKGADEEGEEKLRLTGEGEEDADDLLRVKGGEAPAADKRDWKLRGDGAGGLPEDADEGEADPSIRLSDEEEPLRVPGESDDEYAERKSAMRLKRIGAADGGSDGDDGQERESSTSFKPIRAAAVELANETEGLEKEIREGTLDEIVRKRASEMPEVIAANDPSKAKRWAEGMLSEILQEKVRLSDLAKKLNLSFRQKEIEFRNLEYSLQEELRRKDESLRSKASALAHAKDQIAQMNLTMERLKAKGSGGGSGSGGASDKTKAELLQKSLTAQREENTKLLSKVEDLRNQLAAAQLAKKAGGASSAESKELHEKNQLLVKKLEEMKRAHKDVADKLAEAKRVNTASASEGGLKGKLEATAKQALIHQKEAEKLQLKLQELQKEQLAAKYEVAKLQAEIKQLKAGKGTVAAAPAVAKAAGSKPSGNKAGGGKAA